MADEDGAPELEGQITFDALTRAFLEHILATLEMSNVVIALAEKSVEGPNPIDEQALASLKASRDRFTEMLAILKGQA